MIPNKSYTPRTDKTELIRKKMTRKPSLTCFCPQQQKVSGGEFHICLALQPLLENQNRLHIIFDEKISILHHMSMYLKRKSEVRRALKRSLRSKSSTLGTCKNEVLIRTALLRSQNYLFDTENNSFVKPAVNVDCGHLSGQRSHMNIACYVL